MLIVMEGIHHTWDEAEATRDKPEVRINLFMSSAECLNLFERFTIPKNKGPYPAVLAEGSLNSCPHFGPAV